MEDLSRLRDLVAAGSRSVFFGGAGMSTESGIPDFRSSTGLYTTSTGAKYPPEYLLSHSCLLRQRGDFFDFYRGLMLHPDAKPNAGHLALARLEAAGHLSAVVTQNIDGLHQAAGSRNVVELHGSVHRNYCEACGKRYALAAILESSGVPRCECGGLIRPDVVLYEEALDALAIDAAVSAIADAEVLIVGGTSLNVYPAAGLIRHFTGKALVLVNRDPTPADRFAHIVIHAGLGEVLSGLVPEA